VLAMIGGNMSLGAITTGATGRTYLADVSMFLNAGGPDNFDPSLVFGATPVTSGGSISILGPVSTGSFQAAGASIAAGNINAAAFIDLLSTGGMTLNNLVAGQNIELTSGGAVTLGNGTAGEIIDFDGIGGSLTGLDMTAGDSVEGNAQGSIQLGALSAGIVNPSSSETAEYSVKLASLNGSINVGAVNAPADIAMAAAGTMTTGNLNASGLVGLLADGNMNLGSITTAGSGQTLLADFSMLALGGDVTTDAFDISLVLAATPVATSGSISIGGPVSTGSFHAAAGTSLTTAAISAQTIDARAGGTATINGLWQAPSVELWSNDIDITATGGIDAGNTGLIRLVSTNATQAQIGDGLSGAGYQLSNAEFGRLSSGSLQILGRGDATAATDMLIGDLTITGPTAGSTIDDPLGSVAFATADLATEVLGGVIRVTGDVAASGFSAGNSLEFYADRFELDAATGSISILDSGTTLGGELGLYAGQVHVANGSILDQLALNPQYAGYRNDLNAPAAVQRPGGVLDAGVIWIESDNLQNILIQNTGTAEIPAGFLANEIFVNDDFQIAGPPGSIDIVANGQLITQSGTLTGVAVRDALVAGEDLTPFTTTSMINGCLLTGACGVIPPPPPPPPPFPPDFTPTPGIQDEITLIGDDLLPPPEFGNEDFIDDNDETTDDGETSPIEPPLPLFDTSELDEAGGTVGPEVGTPMRANPGLTETGDVDDPVSGGGNPGLMETPPGPPPVKEKQP
jgi:hypothetical protein